MRELRFSWTFPYRSLRGRPAAPLVPVRLLIDDHITEFQALIDTGAERTLLDGIHLRAAGRDIFGGTPAIFHGFLGVSTTAYEHRVLLQIETVELEMSVAFSTSPIPRQVLGRDVLEHFILGLRERHQECYLRYEE